MNRRSFALSIASALAVTLLACLFYYGTEWVFFVSKPSAFSYLSWDERIAVLFLSPLPLLVTCLPVAFAISAVAVGVARLGSIGERAQILNAALPGLLLACAGLLMVDNFTYTVFGFGVSSNPGAGRLLHTAVFVALLYGSSKLSYRLLVSDWFGSATRKVMPWIVLVVAVGCGLAAVRQNDPVNIASEKDVTTPHSNLPNIIIFSSDGVDADRMSAYGYERDTTPFIRSLMGDMRVYENHYTNAANTTGSIVSLLTGKLPTTTRVVFRPDTLKGADAYEHLPGVLSQNGYDTGDFTVRHYIDPFDLNMRRSFSYANGRFLASGGSWLPAWFRNRFAASSQFVVESYQRIKDRVLHVLFIETFSSPFAQVTQSIRYSGKDRQRVDDLKRFIARSTGPFFANVHLLGTHGKKFRPAQRRWSVGQKQSKPWMRDFYDDAVLNFDAFVAEVVEFLRAEGQLDRTMFIITSDHARRWGVNRPIPLLIRFPGQAVTGVERSPSERVDLAPTILDYLKLDIPEWMEGRSLLSGRVDRRTPILVVSRMPSADVRGLREVPTPKPPFYTLGNIGAMYCDRMYWLSLRRLELSTVKVKVHGDQCSFDEVPDQRASLKFLIDHLTRAGYEVGDLVDHVRFATTTRRTVK